MIFRLNFRVSQTSSSGPNDGALLRSLAPFSTLCAARRLVVNTRQPVRAAISIGKAVQKRIDHPEKLRLY